MSLEIHCGSVRIVHWLPFVLPAFHLCSKCFPESYPEASWVPHCAWHAYHSMAAGQKALAEERLGRIGVAGFSPSPLPPDVEMHLTWES